MGTDLVKSYTRYDFDISSSALTSPDDQNKDIMYQIKDNLVTNCGGSVVSSSDSSTADASDNWSSSSDVVWADPGNPHSWIVIQFDDLSTGFQICIDLNDAASTTENCSVIVSISGFAGGSTTARPTATDESVILNIGNWGGSSNGTYSRSYSIIKSTDNTIIYLLAFIDAAPDGFWLFSRSVNSPSSHTTPVFSYVVGNTPNYSALSSGAAIKTYINSESCSVYMARPYTNVDLMSNLYYYKYGHDTDGSILMWGHSFISANGSYPGSYGYIPDLYFVNSGHSDMNYIFQSDGSTLGWVIYGNFAIPCGSTILPR